MGKKTSKALAIKPKTEVMKVEEDTTSLQPANLLKMAINKDLDIAKLEKLIEMQERFLAIQRKNEFTEAFAQFQRECPILKKLQENKYVNKSNQTVKYKSADLSTLDQSTKEHLANHGLTKEWEFNQTDANIEVTCVITHRNGHQKKVTLKAAKDVSGGKNDIQGLGSTVTYLQRYTFMAALGITAMGMDDDGKLSGEDEQVHGLPVLKEDNFPGTLNMVMKGQWTVAYIEGIHSLSDTQRTALLKAEKEAKH